MYSTNTSRSIWTIQIKIKNQYFAHLDFTTKYFSSNTKWWKKKIWEGFPKLFGLLKKRDFKKGRNNTEDSLNHTGTLTKKHIYHQNILPWASEKMNSQTSKSVHHSSYDTKIQKHQVSSLPFFPESNSSTWRNRNSFQRLTCSKASQRKQTRSKDALD